MLELKDKPAFPQTDSTMRGIAYPTSSDGPKALPSGMTMLEYAAIHLRTPIKDTLDEMIEAYRRDELFKNVFTSLSKGHRVRNVGGRFCFCIEDLAITIPDFIENVTEIADALLAASKVKKEGV